MMSEVEMVAAENAIVGEGPVWSPADRVLYWTDIRSGRMFKFNPAARTNETIHRGVFVGGMAINKHGGLVLGTWEGVMLWRSDDDWRWWHHDEERGRMLQFNDCKAGPDGSFYAGSFFPGEPRGKLYRFLPSGDVEVVAENLGISNGMGWSPDLRTFYHTDSLARTIYRYDYDPATHQLSNRSVFVELSTKMGIPDGMTVDAGGYVWSAIWGSGCIVRFSSDGEEDRRLEFPATQTSSVMFGGEDLSDIYVTSAHDGTGAPPSGMEPGGYDFNAHRGGELYRVRNVDVLGKPEFEAALPW